ncbi:hypothetical protein K3495_g8502 [Podosphaera aphanis]|nr:hypothetical protein K3495_g8502 [Podosphaera aphanis]
MLRDRARQLYYDQLANKGYNFDQMIALTKTHFETEENKQEYLTRWRTTTLLSVRKAYPKKTISESFLADWEGVDGITNDIEYEIDQILLEWDLEEEFTNIDEPAKHSQWITEFGPIDPRKTVVHLNNQSTPHAISKKDIFKKFLIGLSNFPSDTWKQEASIDSRYSEIELHGIMPDTGAVEVLTAGEPQFIALQRLNPDVKIEKLSVGEHKIRFGEGEVTSLGSTEVNTPLGPITFHVVPLNTPFLLCIQDMKRMGVILDNLQNILIQGQKIVPVVMKFGHP